MSVPTTSSPMAPITYASNATFDGVAVVTAGDYPYFDNIPDERYPNASLLTELDEERTVLFASNTGGERVVMFCRVLLGSDGSWRISRVNTNPTRSTPATATTSKSWPTRCTSRRGRRATPSRRRRVVRGQPPPRRHLPTRRTGASTTDATSTASNPDDATSSVTDEENTTSNDEVTPDSVDSTSTNTATATHTPTSSTATSTATSTTSATTSSAPATEATESTSTAAAESSSPTTTSDGCGCRVGVRDLYTASHVWAFVLRVNWSNVRATQALLTNAR